jgi:ketosteroid isomerase-like protein
MVEPLQLNDHTAVVREFFEAAEAADLDRVIAVMHPDIVWEVPGRSPVAGRFDSRDAAVAMLVRIAEMAGGPPQAKMREIFANDDGVVALVDIDMTPPGDQPWHGNDAWLLRTDGSQVTFVREHWFDTRGFDELTAWTTGGLGSTTP